MPSKSEKIITLLAETGLTRAEIAEKVGCLQAYVRVVEQRFQGRNATKTWQYRNWDRVLKASADYRRNRLESDPEYRDILRAQNHASYIRRKERAA